MAQAQAHAVGRRHPLPHRPVPRSCSRSSSHKMVEYGQKLGLDMIQGDHEDAPGQIELNFGSNRAEQQLPDNLVRRGRKQVGRELGRSRSSAEPCLPWYQHLALARSCSCPTRPCTRTQVGLQVIGALLRATPGVSLVLPRLILADRAPVFADWGYQTRPHCVSSPTASSTARLILCLIRARGRGFDQGHA